MGFSLARTAWYRGAEVTVISGPVSMKPLHGVRFIPVVTADQMRDAVLKESEKADIIVKAAAVGDYKASGQSPQKIKRNSGPLTLDLTPNPDILAELGKKRKKGQMLIGFAAETQDLIENASSKLASKGIDLIAVNDVNAPESGFAADTNEVQVLDASGVVSCIAGTKDDVAEGLWDVISQRRPTHS
jgi:phosphopantothenoylcysteine decarboxylase/phosphopantothenate--cysteine ligase